MNKNNNNRIRVAVLYGGRSREHDISVLSAQSVVQQLDRTRFTPVLIAITKEGYWVPHEGSIPLSAPALAKLSQNGHASMEDMQLQLLLLTQQLVERPFDVIFPALHGVYCEDGSLQGVLESASIPYVGCGVLSSAIGMDKDVAKRLAIQAGVPVGPYCVVTWPQWQQNPDAFCKQVKACCHYPVFVKPANTGSSVGVSKVKTPEALKSAIEEAFMYDNKILVEEGIDARELEIAILEQVDPTEKPLISVVGEIKTTHEFYSYIAKYEDPDALELIIPADIAKKTNETIRKMAQQLFEALEISGMARIDFLMDKKTEKIYFNEINTIPGFTTLSMYPKLIEASGVSYSKLITQLIELALKKQKMKARLKI